jgi:para-nitrobenzyl esterase
MSTIVETSYGKLEGVEQDGLAVFRGIPFAQPPVGKLRYRAPQHAERWDGVRDATQFGPACPQGPRAGAEQPASVFGGMFAQGELDTSEDCLTLSVWTPGADGAQRPVMVWIHGGGFRTGTGSSPMYDAVRLATRGDVVVVTINYRLAIFGFLHLASLEGANFGILDPVAALEWVRDEIAAFGGDPDQVTIFGESAGAKSVETVLATPASKGLYHRAIAQSTYRAAIEPEAAALTASKVLARLELDAGDAETAEALRAIPGERLLEAQQLIQEEAMAAGLTGGAASGFAPVIDGDVLPERPVDAIAGGIARDVPLLLGTNLDESKLFGAMMPALRELDEAGLVQRLTAVIPGADRDEAVARRAVDAYRAAREARGEPAGPSDIWFAISTDSTFGYHSSRVAGAQSARQERTYKYLFTWQSEALDGALGACHALELPFVFDNWDNPLAEIAGPGAKASALARGMQDAWLAFAKTGDPNHEGLPAWDRFDAETRGTMILGERCGMQSAPLEEKRLFWASLS